MLLVFKTTWLPCIKIALPKGKRLSKPNFHAVMTLPLIETGIIRKTSEGFNIGISGQKGFNTGFKIKGLWLDLRIQFRRNWVPPPRHGIRGIRHPWQRGARDLVPHRIRSGRPESGVNS